MTTEYTLPPKATPTNHGHTAASWIMTLGVIAGALIAGVGMVILANNVVIVGLVVMVGAVVASIAARLLGHGQELEERASGDWYSSR